MKTLLKYPEIKECWEELKDLINQPKVTFSSIMKGVYCEVLERHGCIGKYCEHFKMVEPEENMCYKYSDYLFDLLFESRSYCEFEGVEYHNRYKKYLSIEIYRLRQNPNELTEKLFQLIYNNVPRYYGKEQLEIFKNHFYVGKDSFIVEWLDYNRGETYYIEKMNEINNSLSNKPIIQYNKKCEHKNIFHKIGNLFK